MREPLRVVIQLQPITDSLFRTIDIHLSGGAM